MAELVSDVSLDKFLIFHARHDHQVLATTHMLSIARGIILAFGVFAAAPGIAELFNAPNAIASFRSVSALLLLRGFAHLDIKQVVRDYSYAADAKTNVISQLAAVAAAYPAVLTFHDHRAIVWSLYVEYGGYVLASHLFSRTWYSAAATDTRVLREALAFGLPLTVNGIGLALLAQFDKAIVSHWLGLETLAFYAVIMSIAVVPVSVILRILNALAVPFLARTREDPSARGHAYGRSMWTYSVVGAAYAAFIAGTLDKVAPKVFGDTYVMQPQIVALVTLIAWARITRAAPVSLMLANGKTQRVTATTIVYSLGLILATAMLPFFPSLETVLLGLLCGEVLSDIVAFWISHEITTGRWYEILAQLFWSLVAAAACAAVAYEFPSTDFWSRLAVLSGLVTVITGAQVLYGVWPYLFRKHIPPALVIRSGPPEPVPPWNEV